MDNISDQTGRGFEFAIVDELRKQDGVSLTDRAQADQVRDGVKFRTLDQYRMRSFQRAASALATILRGEPFMFATGLVDRLPDDDAREGDVTDIRIHKPNGCTINLSIKNNHHALKHQRPPSLMQQLGFPKKSYEDFNYRTELQKRFDAFYREAKLLCPKATTFPELKLADPNFISSHLYAPVCDLVVCFLRNYLKDANICITFFTFLVGNTDYIKVIFQNGNLEFVDFSSIKKPTSCDVAFNKENPSYIYLTFNNGWKLNLRLHTASSRLAASGSTPSLKFDTQPIDKPLPRRIIPVM